MGLIAFPLAGTAVEQKPSSPLRSVNQVRRLTADEAAQGLAVQLEGVVTLIDRGHYFFFLQDSTGGIYVNGYTPKEYELLSEPPWWTGWRLMQAGGMLIVLTLASLAWVVLLRRQVRRQTAVIQEKLDREEQLQRTYKKLVDNAVDMMFTVDMSGKLITLNPTGEKLIGVVEDDIKHQQLSDWVVSEDKAQLAEWHRACMQDAGNRSCELDFVTRQGQDIRMEIRGRRIRHLDGEDFLEGIARDISERKSAERQVRLYFHAMEQSPAVIVITNTNGDIEYVNPKFTELSGYSFTEVRGKNPRVLKSGVFPPESYAELWTTISAGGEWRGEFHNRKKNGELYWEAAAISPVRDGEGLITHYVAVKEDITRRKQLEAEQEKLIRELQDALAKVKTLSGLLPVCASCKKIRDDNGYWNQLESYLGSHSDVLITHGICPDCMKRLYPEFHRDSE
jgi:PAS domain S-box-containing protein